MKKFYYLSLVIFSLAIFNESKAQVSVSININSQPLWGPVGYNYVQYYYMPEINAYYNVSNRKYTYWKGNKWVSKSKLPKEYRNFDIYRTYKVVVNEREPWHRHHHIHNKYRGYAHNHSQVVLRDARRHPHAHSHYDKNGRNDSKKNNSNYKHKKHDDRGKHSHRRG